MGKPRGSIQPQAEGDRDGQGLPKSYTAGKEEVEYLRDEYEDEVEFIGIPARSNDFGDEEMAMCQRFRAGIEGSISFLNAVLGSHASDSRDLSALYNKYGVAAWA